MLGEKNLVLKLLLLKLICISLLTRKTKTVGLQVAKESMRVLPLLTLLFYTQIRYISCKSMCHQYTLKRSVYAALNRLVFASRIFVSVAITLCLVFIHEHCVFFSTD